LKLFGALQVDVDVRAGDVTGGRGDGAAMGRVQVGRQPPGLVPLSVRTED